MTTQEFVSLQKSDIKGYQWLEATPWEAGPASRVLGIRRGDHRLDKILIPRGPQITRTQNIFKSHKVI